MPDLYAYRINAPYITGVSTFPETTQYNFRAGSHELLLFLARLSAQEVKAIRSAPMQIGVIYRSPVLVFLYRVEGAIEWSDAPYSWWRVPEAQRTAPLPLGERETALLQIVLVAADTGRVQALRVGTLPRAVAHALHRAIEMQMNTPWNADAYDAAVDTLQSTLPSDELARQAQAAGQVGWLGIP